MDRTKCSIGDCPNPSRRLKMCDKHSTRYYKYGDPGFTKYRSGSLRDRLESSIDRSAGVDSCHPWTGGCNENGYGIIRFQGEMMIVNRALMAENVGRKLASREWVLHRCDTPVCCNVKHLYLGDPKQNAQDRKVRGRHWRDRTPVKTHCKRKHEYTEANTYMTATGRSCRKCRSLANRKYAASRTTGGQ